MRDSIRVVISGTGQMGSGIARMVHAKPGLELVGAFAKRADWRGRDLGEVIGLDFDRPTPNQFNLNSTNSTEAAQPAAASHFGIEHYCSDKRGHFSVLCYPMNKPCIIHNENSID